MSAFAEAITLDGKYRETVLRLAGVHTVSPERTTPLDLWVDGWFNGSEWVFQGFSSSIEAEALMNDDVGPLVGSMGEVRWFWRHARPLVVKETLLRLTSTLQRASYRGPFGVRLVRGVREHGVAAARAAYSAVSVDTLERLLEFPLTEWTDRVVYHDVHMAKPRREFAAAALVVHSLVPFPPTHASVVGVTGAGIAQLRTALADALDQARDAYPEVMFRTDIVQRAVGTLRWALADGVKDHTHDAV